MYNVALAVEAETNAAFRALDVPLVCGRTTVSVTEAGPPDCGSVLFAPAPGPGLEPPLEQAASASAAKSAGTRVRGFICCPFWRWR
jgi:hypothetical protein